MNYITQNPQWVREEARRCLYCVDAPCTQGCPANIDIAQFIRHLRVEDVKSAKKVIKDSNPLGGICAYLCPSEELCQSKCVMGKCDRPIRIRELQKFICDNESYQGRKMPANGKKVAVIGAGPAGLACADTLSLNGFSVDVYDKQGRMGGLINSEIPQYRIPQEAMEKDLMELCTENITYAFGKEITPDALKEMTAAYDAIFLSYGLVADRDAGVVGSSKNMLPASEFLSAVKEGKYDALSGIVYTIGGGDSAIDAALTALKLGAASSVLAYRRSRQEMPASDEALMEALDAGVEVMYKVSPVRVEEESGALKVTFVRNELVQVEGEARKSFRQIPDSTFSVDASFVIFALGKLGEHALVNAAFSEGLGQLDESTLRLGQSNIFAGGDIINGGATVVQAVRDGKRAAASIMEFLG